MDKVVGITTTMMLMEMNNSMRIKMQVIHQLLCMEIDGNGLNQLRFGNISQSTQELSLDQMAIQLGFTPQLVTKSFTSELKMNGCSQILLAIISTTIQNGHGVMMMKEWNGTCGTISMIIGYMVETEKSKLIYESKSNNQMFIRLQIMTNIIVVF